MSWKPDMFIYHSPCDDGFGAAWAAHQRWGDAVDYVPANYGQPAPDVAGKHVLIGDFSYKRAAIDEMLRPKRVALDEMLPSAASVVILDHHKTAEADLAAFRFEESSPGAVCADDVDGMLRDLAELGRPPCIAVFDMQRSGARMVWQFCHPADPVPQLIRYVEDRDLWRFAYPETKAVSLFLRSHPYDFATWSMFAEHLETEDGDLIGQARAIEKFYTQVIQQLADIAGTALIDGIGVPVVNCGGMFASDVGHELLHRNPSAPFVATYSDRHGARGYSLRSEDHRMDVSAVAQRYGGGGHRNAAGFEVPLP